MQRTDLEKRLSQIERKAADERRAFAAERKALTDAMRREEIRGSDLRDNLEAERAEKTLHLKQASHLSRLLDEEKARSGRLDAELAQVQRARETAKKEADHYLKGWRDDRAILDDIRDRTSQEARHYNTEIERLQQALKQARNATRQPGADSQTHWLYTRRDENEEPTSKKKKLRQALDAAEQRISAQDQKLADLSHERLEMKRLLDWYQGEYEARGRELRETQSALERERAAGRKVVTAVVEAKLQGTGVSYSGALNGGYNPNRDGLALRKQDELLAAADLARWQALNGKRKTAREFDMNKSVEDQAVELAIAARWTLLSAPPKALRWRPSWAMWGFVLDDASEQYLCELSTSATMDMTLAVPKKERRMGRY